ncbi:CsgG/HfaB family protein [Candidatus Marinimicrobia bacterium]|nr:CsgG/HfaB family protein [Candidatus Neomarinimicrobiota bacterium]
MRRYTYILLFITFSFAMETVAIIDFEGIGVSDMEAKALTKRLTTEMIKVGKFTIVERSEMKRLLDEQKFQYSGCVDVSCAVQIGKMLGAKSMIVGSVSKLGNTYSVDSRLIDVKTSESYISSNFTHKGNIGGLLDGMIEMSYELCEQSLPLALINEIKEPFAIDLNNNKDSFETKDEIKDNNWYINFFQYAKVKRLDSDGTFEELSLCTIRYKFLQYKRSLYGMTNSNNAKFFGEREPLTLISDGLGVFYKLNEDARINLWYMMNPKTDSSEPIYFPNFFDISLEWESKNIFSIRTRFEAGLVVVTNDDYDSPEIFEGFEEFYVKVSLLLFSFGR